MASPFTPEQLADLERRRNEDRTDEIRAAYIAPIPIMLVATSLRIYVKKTGRNKITLDDYLIVFATICALGECIAGLVYGPPYGFGRHITAVSAEDLRTFRMGDYIFSHFYNVALGTIKLAILAFYYRIFSIQLFRRVVIFSATFVALWLLTITLMLALVCRPLPAYWDSRVQGKCINLVAFTYFTNITNLVTDVWIFLLPVPVILRLHVTLARKLALLGVFLIGLGVCIISAVRLNFVITQGSPDFTWEGVPLGALSVFEPLGGILCSNLPIIYPLFSKTAQKVKSLTNTVTGRSKGLSSSGGAQSGVSGSGGFRRPRDGESMEQWRQLKTADSSTDISPAYYNTNIIKGPSTSKSIDDDLNDAMPMDSIVVEREIKYEVQPGVQ